jgi:hypothetical protein
MLTENIVDRLFYMYALGEIGADNYYELLELLDEAFKEQKAREVA